MWEKVGSSLSIGAQMFMRWDRLRGYSEYVVLPLGTVPDYEMIGFSRGNIPTGEVPMQVAMNYCRTHYCSGKN